MATPELPASSPRHVVHGSTAAFAGGNAGSPASFLYAWGTWQSPDAGMSPGLAQYGVISNYNIDSLGEKQNLKDGGGSTFAHVITDPGWKITCDLVHAIGAPGSASPVKGQIIKFKKILEPEIVAAKAYTAVASGAGAKAMFTMVSTTGYVVGELVQVTGGTYAGTYPILTVTSPTTLTLDVPFGLTTTGTISAPRSLVNPTLKAVVVDVKGKWEREGWRGMSIEAEARDSMNLGVTYGVRINEVGLVTSVLYDGT